MISAPDSYVSTGPARRHITLLLANGWAATRIADLTAMTPHAITTLATDPVPWIHVDAATQICALGTPAFGLPHVPALGTRRRAQALAVLGWPVELTTAYLDLPAGALDSPTVPAPAAAAMTHLYRRTALTPATGDCAERTRALALRAGWAGPLSWDGNDLDDPAKSPEQGPTDQPGTDSSWSPRTGAGAHRPTRPRRPPHLTRGSAQRDALAAAAAAAGCTVRAHSQRTRGAERRQASAEPVRDLLEQGMTVTGIAARLGVQPGAVRRRLLRAG